MKMIAITAFAALAAVGQSRMLSLKQEVVVDIDDAAFDQKVRFQAFKTRFNKKYDTIADEAYAMEAFAAVDADIQAHNAGDNGFMKGHNQFSDIKPEHFKERIVGDCHKQTKLLRKAGAEPHTYTEEDYNVAAATTVDWRKKGAVTPVKNQGQCGSCWSFSTTGSVEGNYQINTGTLTSLSEQELVDCDTTDNGCSGGLMDNAFSWIQKNGGLPTESSYPYTARDGTCNKNSKKVVTITGHKDVTRGDEKALLTAVNQQPVSIAVEADQSVFQSYKSGVISSKSCGTQLDHGVLIVGYGTENGKDYWLVKNSWGSVWGDEGYLKIERGNNICGISESASYPTGAKSVGPAPGPTPPGPSPTPPGPSPTPPSPSGSHYEDPKGGCRSDEEAIQIQGVQGDACVPKCKLGFFCPSDVPSGVTAKPQCALQDQQGDKFCILICNPSSNATDANQCGENASCKSISGVGICTYDD